MMLSLIDRSRARFVATLASCAALAACSSNPSPIDSGSTDGGVSDARTEAGTDAPAADVSSDTAAVDAGTDVVMDVGAASDATDSASPVDVPPADAAIDVSTADVISSATITVRDAAVYSNCQPGLPRMDPILAFWTADVRNAASPTATLTSAILTIAGSTTMTQRLTVDVPVITLTGGSGSQDMRKIAADMNPTMACGEICSGATATLELHFSVDGTEVVVTDSQPFSCVY